MGFKKGHKINLGRKHSYEHNRKIGLSQIGRPPTKGRAGIPHTEETKRKIALKHIGLIPWNKGMKTSYSDTALRSCEEYKEWRLRIQKRDDYVCQICFVRGGVLQVDHIKPWAKFPELRLELTNGRTLCVSCHRKTDTYGKRKIYVE